MKRRARKTTHKRRDDVSRGNFGMDATPKINHEIGQRTFSTSTIARKKKAAVFNENSKVEDFVHFAHITPFFISSAFFQFSLVVA